MTRRRVSRHDVGGDSSFKDWIVFEQGEYEWLGGPKDGDPPLRCSGVPPLRVFVPVPTLIALPSRESALAESVVPIGTYRLVAHGDEWVYFWEGEV